MNIDPVKILKISAGAALSAALCYGLDLQYAVSGGIICLLTIQDTRKETLSITLKRLVTFCVTALLCLCIFGITGYGLIQLGLVLALLLIFCGLVGMNEAIAMNSVIATHFFASQSVSPDMILNELALFSAGAGMGILLNIFVPSNEAKIRRIQRETDERIRRIIGRMSVYITAEDKSDYTGSCFEETNRLLDELKREAVKYIGNAFVSEKDYFYKYVGMRMEQCIILIRIYTDIKRLSIVTSHAKPIADFLEKTSAEFSEINDAESLLAELGRLFAYYSEEELPKSRTEFENRALLYHILCDLKSLVSLKADFAARLTDSEKKRYWIYLQKSID